MTVVPAVALVALSLSACGVVEQSVQDAASSAASDLTSSAAQAVDAEALLVAALTAAGGQEVTVSLADVFPVDWSAYHVVCPYETADQARDALGVANWPDAPDLAARDDVQVLAFATGTDVVASYELGRSVLDLCSAQSLVTGTRDTALTFAYDAADGTWSTVQA